MMSRQPRQEENASMWDTALRALEEQDTFAAIEYLCRQTDTAAAATAFVELVRHLYWKQKDICRTVWIAQAGIQYALTSEALEAQDAEEAVQLRGIAKGLAYDLGSFTWPGWDEAG